MPVLLHDIFFCPPMAIARFGSSDTPSDAFEWERKASPEGTVQTTLRPVTSLDVCANGSVSARLPTEIRFKDDDGSIRPVAPFLEVWARVARDGGALEEVPLTPSLLRELGVELNAMRWTVSAANDKAWQRTGAPNCRFEARLVLAGDDHERHALDAISPVSSGQIPLVPADSPIRIGQVQLLCPDEPGGDVPLDTIRVRFTPGKGYCYAPPDAIVGVSSPLEPGDMAPTASLYGNMHEIVPEERRTLSPGTEWSNFVMDSMAYPHGTPIDAYDGANVGTSTSWGVVDDSCDALIEVELAIAGRPHRAEARVFTGPPDFAPDRRNFHSLVDDIEDRMQPADAPVEDGEEAWEEVLDLFRRIFETASLFNLDMHRTWATGINAYRLGITDVTDASWDDGTSPRIGPNSMTAADAPYADKVPDLIPDQAPSVYSESIGSEGLPYTEVVDFVHRALADDEVLASFLRRRPDRIRTLVRPPLGRFAELPPCPGVSDDSGVRDPRTLRDRLYDMRMPPYMRDTMGYPLTLTHRQYDILLAVLDRFEAEAGCAQDTTDSGHAS